MTLYRDFVRGQKVEFVRQFLSDPNYCWVRIKGLKDLENRYHENGKGLALKKWGELAGFDPNNAFVWDAHGSPELWVKPEDKSKSSRKYARAWEVFAKKVGRVDVEPLHPEHHLDHLSPETAAYRQGYSHVRLMPVDAGGNVRVGTTIERTLAIDAGKAGGFQADYAVAAKALGMTGSFAKRRPPEEIIRELAELLDQAGMRIDEQTLKDLVAWVSFRRS